MRTPGHFLCMLFCISTVFLLATHVKYFKNQGRETAVVRKSLVETLGPVKAASGQLPFWCSEDPNKDSVGQKAWENGRREEDNLMNSLFPRHLAADWWLLAPLHPPPHPPPPPFSSFWHFSPERACSALPSSPPSPVAKRPRQSTPTWKVHTYCSNFPVGHVNRCASP